MFGPKKTELFLRNPKPTILGAEIACLIDCRFETPPYLGVESPPKYHNNQNNRIYLSADMIYSPLESRQVRPDSPELPEPTTSVCAEPRSHRPLY